MLGGNVDAAITAGDVHIAAPGNDGDWRFARHRNVEVGFDGMISGGLGLGIDRNQATDRRNSGLGFMVILVGVVLIVGANALADHYRNLVIVGSVNADRPVRVNDLDAGARREVLLEMIVEVVAMTENVAEVAVVEVELVMQTGPVHVLDLGRDQSENHDHDDQDHAPSADSRGTITLALRALMLDQLDHSPDNQQRRPVIGKQVRQAANREDAHGGHQKDGAENDQDARSGKGPAARRRWNNRRNSGSHDWVRHFSPRSQKPSAPDWAAPAAAEHSVEHSSQHREA